jgi:hypothetical protein
VDRCRAGERQRLVGVSLGPLLVIHLVVLVPPVAGSAGVHYELDAIIKKLEEIHVNDVGAVAMQLARLSKDDRERLVNEIDELQRHGQKLAEIVHEALEW